MISRDQFNREVQALTSAMEKSVTYHLTSKTCSKTLESSDKNDYCTLNRWILLDGNNVNEKYLSAPPIVRQYQKRKLCFLDKNQEELEYDLEFSNEDVLLDSNYFSNACLDSECRDESWFEWLFSVVYSDIWCVPVLYFRVQHLDGTTCSRNEVLNLLKYREHLDPKSFDSWDFISEEEHPVTGVPSQFLHPCQTSARLTTLMAGFDENYLPGKLLLSWMSLMLPAVHCKIPLIDFMKCNEIIHIQ